MKRLLKRTLSLILAMIMVMGVLPMNTMAAMIMGNPDGGRVETPVIDRSDPIVDTHAKSISTGHERPEPGPSEGPGDEAEILWDDLTVTAVIDPDTGAYTVTVTSTHPNASIGDSALALVPDVGTQTAGDLIANGDIGDTSTAANWSNNNFLADMLGVDPGTVHIQDVSGRTTGADGSLTMTGTLKGFNDYLALAQKGANGGSLTPETGIPMTVILVSQGTRTGINVGYVTYKPAKIPHALLGVEEEIVLAAGVTTSHDSPVDNRPRPGNYEHTPDILITDVKYGGTGVVKTLSRPQIKKMESNNLAVTIEWNDDEGNSVSNITGVLTVTYNVVDPTTGAVLYRDLEETIPVRTEGPSAKPIEVTVWTTDDPDTPEDDTVKDNVTTTFTFDYDEDEDGMDGAGYMVLMSIADFTDENGVILGTSRATQDAVFTPADGAPTVEIILDAPYVDDDTFLLTGSSVTTPGSGTISVVKVTAGTKKGDYTGVVNVCYNSSASGTSGDLAIPIIVHVKAIQGEAVFHRNLNGTDTDTSPAHGSTYTGDAGTTLTTMPGAPFKTGSTFKGWATSNNATDVLSTDDIVYGSGMKADGKAAHYYAVWETTVQTYNVTYHLGTGESWPSGVSDPSQTGVTTHKVTAETPTKSGYDFLGWTTVSDGSATAADSNYAANKVIVLSSNVDLYPVWAKLYSITYTNPGATGVATTETAPMIALPNASTSQSGKPVTVSSSIALNSSHQDTGGRYYKFKGWNDGTTTHDPAATFTMPTSNVTLEAQWELEKVTVTLDPRSHGGASIPSAWGSSAPYAQSINKGANITLPTLTETGWTFKGWATSADNAAAGTVAVNGGAAVSNVLADVTYYAVWEETQYTVTFNPNGGTWGNAPTTGTKTSSGTLNAKITVPDTLTRSGYSFKEWNTQQNGTGEKLDTASHTYGAKSGNIYYAIWDQLYTVTYQDATDTADHTYPKIGTSLPTDTAKKAGDSVTVKYASGYAVNAEKTNTSGLAYKFLGWTIAPTVTVTSGTFSMPANNVTLTANWEPVMQKVTYKHNGMKESDGTNTPDYVVNNAVQKGADYTIAVNDPVWAGHTFSGWTVTSGATTASGLHKNDTVSGVTGDVVLTAQWSENSYTVKFWMNDGETPAVAHDTQSVVHGNKATKPTADPTRTGYDFGGWYKEEGCTNAVNFNDAITSDTNYYAKWTLKNYAVTYAWGNIGTTVKTATGTAVSLPNQSNVNHGGNFNVATTPNTTDIYLDSNNTGWKLTGWTISGTGQSGSKAPGAEVTNVASAITLTGEWARETRKVSYDLNSKTFASDVLTAPGDTTVNYNATANLSTAVTMNQNYVDTDGKGWTFKGWGAANNTAVGSNITSIANVTEDKTVYAIWVPTTYTVTFYPNGGNNLDGTNATKAVTVQHGDKVADTDVPTATRTGYTFSKWVEGSASSTTEFVNSTRMITANLSVYAMWDVDHYKVEFHFNGKGGTDTTETQEVGKNVALKTPSAVTGYTFGGWYTDNGTFASQQSGPVSGTGRTDGEVVKLYAKWTPIEYTITYADPQSGAASGMPSPLAQKGNYDSTHTLASAPTGKTGYVWDGWYDGNSKVAADFTITGDRTLNAKWKITVSFEIHDPQSTPTLSNPDAQVIAAGGTIALPAQTNLTDYTFQGWFTEASGGSKKGSTDTYSVPTTLHAQWKATEYTYTFNPNNGAFPDGTTNTSTKGGVGTAISAPSNNPTRANYTFLGWGAASTSTTADATVATTMPSGGGTVYAVWEANTYGYVFDPNEGAFANGETGLQGDGTVKLTGAAGATVSAPTDPTRTKYKFDAWYTGKTDGTKVTTHTITGNAADGAVTNTVYAHWIPLYDVVYINGDAGDQHGTVDTTKNDLNKAARTYSVLGGSEVITTGGTWSGDYFTDTDGKHWKFNGWKASSDNSKLYSKGTPLTVNQDVTLTAQWDEYYLVTLAPPVLTDTATALGDHVTAKLGGGTAKDSSHSESSRQVWVKKNDSVAITELALKTNANNYIFAKWTATASTGAFGTDGATAQATAYTPTADVTLTPNYWRKPTLTDKDSYHQNFATDATVANDEWGTATKQKGTNTLPAYTWTKNSATLTSTDTLQIELTSGNWSTLNVADAVGTGVDVVKSTDANGNVTYTFQRDYLMTLVVPMGDTCKPFNIRVQSDTPDTTTTNHADTTLTAVLEIAVNPDPLTKVNIQVEDKVSATAKVGVTTRDSVIYKDHEKTTITKTNQLTYTWYVSKGASTPTQKSYSTNLAGHAASVTGAKSDAADLGTVIGTADTTDDFVNLTAAHKGKYIYAVVAATNTGYGAVITNAIAVDYDAVIKVTKDGSTSITGGNYTVYLVPQPTTGSNAAGYAAANLPASKVVTTYQSGTNDYKTADSALTGGVTYDVYVNKVEGDATYFVKTGKTVSTQTDATANNIPTVEFFSVTAVDTTVNHAKDSNSVPVGEAFGENDVPGITLTTGDVTAAIPSGNGVFKGSVVTAKTDSDSWGQDYNVDWGKTTTQPSDATPLAYTTTTDQTKAEAKSTGTTGHAINGKTWIGARLDQNLYTVTGNIWVNGGTASAGILTGTDDVPVLTYKNGDTTYTFKANSVTSNGGHKGDVTFTTKVPKSSAAAGSAITGKYDITAKPKANTTIIKYIPGQNKNTASDTSIKNVNALGGDGANTLNVDITANNTQAFTIVLEASTYILNVKDTETPDANSATQTYTDTGTVNPPATTTTAGNFTTAAWTVNYAYAAGKTYTITVTNQGNTTLDVSLNILKATATTDAANNGYIYGDKATQTGDTATDLTSGGVDDYNDTSFGGLAKSFTLVPEGTKTFTVTVPAGMDVNKTARYDFQFTSVEHGTTGVYGPSVTYRLNETINPLKITDIQSESPSANTWAPKDLAIAGSTAIPAGVTVANEVEYKWYVAPKSTSNVAINKTGTGTLTGTNVRAATAAGVSGNNYTLQAADQGMSLYLVAHNKGTGNVTEADFVKVADLPYDMDIIVKENTTNVAVADKGNYEVYLRPSGNTGTFSTSESGVIKATADNTNAGVYTASNLVSGTTYKIYTNAVGGTKDNWQDSGETATLAKFLAGTKPEVVYHDVIINNTATVNTPYTISASDTKFLNDADATTPIDVSGLEKPTAVLKGTTTKVADPDAAASKWVQDESKITLTYQDWNRDYKLDWLTAASGSVATDPAAAVTTDVTVSAAATTIDTKLTLNLYSVTLTVTGSGTLDEVYMTDSQGNIFTSAATDADNDKLHATGSNPAAGSAFGAGTYTFSVPKDTTYKVKGKATDGTTLQYYKVPADSSTEIIDDDIGTTTMSVTDNTSTFLINLSAVGQYMQVEDDQTPVGGSVTAHAAGIAYVKGTTPSDPGTAGSTIEVPYGKTAKDVIVDVRNTSGEDAGNTLYDVTWVGTNTSAITADADELAALNGTDLLNRAAASDPAPEESVTLSVASGLSVGTYTYTADVTFNSKDGDASLQGKVTYTLTVKVVPTEFTAVTVADEDGNAVSGMLPRGKDLKFSTFTTSTENDWDSTATPPVAKTLVATGDDPDYTYQWYYGTTASPTVSWNKDTAAVTVSGDLQAIPSATGATLDDAVIANYPGKNIYLVISAVKDKNVIKAAISAPVTTGFQPVVKISVDGTDLTADPGDNSYVVTLTQGSNTWPTVWDDTAKGYVPVNNDTDKVKVSLDATKEYTVNANKYKGGAANDLVEQGTKLSNASASARTTTVPYFTVNAVEVKDYEAISGLGESVTVPVPTFTLGGVTITSDVPVLKDQAVDAKMGAWTEDYTLTWYTKVTTTAPVPGDTPSDPGAYADTNPTMEEGATQNVTAATVTGITGVEVSGKTYIGGRLDQNTYTVTGKVKGDTGTVTQVQVKQVGADDAVVTTYVWPDNGTDKTGTLKIDGNGNGKMNPNDTVEFTVVKGDYTIISTPDGSTVIESVVWEPNGVNEMGTVESDKTGVLTKKNVAALSDTNTRTGYDFEINVVGSSLSLTANDIASNTVVTSGLNDYSNGKNTVVRYFSHIDKKNNDALDSDVTSFPVVLENTGNMDLDVALDVFYFDTTKKSVLNAAYYSTDSHWEGTSPDNTPVFSAGSSATASQDIAFAVSSGKTVLNLANVMKTGTTVPAGAKYNATAENDTSVAAATLNLGTDAWSKDSGVFVFRFKGHSSAGDVIVYYVLDLTVEQLPIVEVYTQMNGDATATGMPGVDDKLQAKGYDANDDESLNNVKVKTSTKPDQTDAATAKLTDDDVKFAWVSVPGGTANTDNGATILSKFTVDANGELVTSTPGYKVDVLDKEYTLTAADMDRDFYLIAYAPNTTAAPLATNAKDKAISDVVKTKRTVGVQVSLDGPTNIQPNSGTEYPGYVIFLVEDGENLAVTKEEDGSYTTGSGTWATKWSDNSDKVYQAPIDLNKTYHVYAPSFKGGDTYVDTGLTLGKQVTGDPVEKVTVPYWSVAHTTNVAVDNTNDGFAPYLPSSNNTSKANNQIQEALTVKVSKTKTGAAADGDTLPTPTPTAPSTPVLEGMKVQVTVDATKKSSNADTTGKVKKSWSEATDLHTMTTNGWQPGTDTSATSTTQMGVAYPTDDGEGKFLIQSTDITVTSAKSFSATLKQVRFTVTFVVKDNTPGGTNTGGITPAIDSATLKTDKTKETAPEAANFTASATSIGTGTDGATVTFNNIPAGAFEIVAVGGEKTNVDGYTWNAEDDALNDPKYPGTIVQVTSDDHVNTHAGNTIQIQYSSNAIRWYDNFNTADGTTLPDPTVEDGPEFVRSSGFEKVDTAGTGPFLALTEGYDESKGDVLTYKVRVVNTGANDLDDFRITRATAGLTDLTADLTQVTVYDVDGNPKAGTADVTQMGFKLGVGETVEFEVKIPTDQAASSTRYSNAFSVQSSNDGTVAGGSYTPAYQVKPAIDFEPGKAQVIYGNNKFEDTPTDIAPTWDTDVYSTDNFEFSVATEAELTTLLNGAARPANVYTKLGNDDGDKKLPDWLVLNTSTGAVTFDTNLYATDVNVQVKNATDFDNYTASEVDNEVVFYIKATDKDTGKVYYTTYTVDVEPGELEIVGDSFNPGDPISGQAVDKDKFTYTNVTNQIGEDVVAATDIAGDGNNTAKGNTDAKDSKVNVNGVHTATWTVDPGIYAEGSANYTFTVTYKPDTAAEKWNYKPASVVKPIEARKPDLSLDFADEIKNYDDVKDVLKLGTAYSKVADPEDYDPDTATQAPKALEYTEETYRKGETITYLDEEPIYTVRVKKIGGLYNMSLTEDEGTKGFQVVDADGKPAELPKFTGGDQTLTFYVKLSEISDGLWAGEHKIKFTAEGYTTDVEADQTDANKKTATYELEFTVEPKTIPKAHVTGLTDPKWDEKPDKTITVTGEDPTDPTKDVELDKFTDKHGNHPITTPKVEITPEDERYKPGKDYTTTVVLTPDPNYTFEDKTPEEEAPNYTAGGETPDDGYTVTVTPDTDPTKENKEIKFEKTVPIPHNGLLKFDDKKVDGATPTATDPATTGPEIDDVRGTITISKGSKLGKYEINLGAYDNDITNVTLTQDTNTLPAEGLKWELTPKVIDKLEKNGAKTTYTLDMTEVDTNNLNAGTYTLKLTAMGWDPNNRSVSATYTLTIRVSSPGGGGGSSPSCPNQVTFLLGLQGTTNDPVMEMVANNGKVKSVPGVTALEGYQFIGWSRTAPTGDLDKDSKRGTEDPKSVSVNGNLTFYAVYQKLYDVPKPPFHEHYVIGYPNGNFGPADDINRASVATIIARAVLPNFVEGADYGNPGGYSDVDGHWAASAIAYCSKYGVFKGYEDGTFRPDQSITRQELALVMARLSGVQKAKAMPFTDIADAGNWAVDGIYTAYVNGWVIGYPDGTFKPLNPIRRDETVKIFNAYLRRGVDAEGLSALTEYVHSGVASNVTENGTTEYMTWPDVTRDQWAYYEIIEAANDHEFKVDPTVPGGYVVPETWDKCWIDEKWRYHDDLTDGGPTTGLLAAGFRIWSK